MPHQHKHANKNDGLDFIYRTQRHSFGAFHSFAPLSSFTALLNLTLFPCLIPASSHNSSISLELTDSKSFRLSKAPRSGSTRNANTSLVILLFSPNALFTKSLMSL